MLVYVVPAVVFLIVSLVMYKISKDTKKSEPKTIMIRNVLPGIVIGVLVFVFMKYRKTMFNSEPMMGGNFFDNGPVQS
jgi:hypothetical protein